MKMPCQKLNKQKLLDNNAVYDTPRYASEETVSKAAVSYNKKEGFVKSCHVFVELNVVARSLSKSPLTDCISKDWPGLRRSRSSSVDGGGRFAGFGYAADRASVLDLEGPVHIVELCAMLILPILAPHLIFEIPPLLEPFPPCLYQRSKTL